MSLQKYRAHFILPAVNKGKSAAPLSDYQFEKTKVEATAAEASFYMGFMADSQEEADRIATHLANVFHLSCSAELGSLDDLFLDNPSSLT